MKFKKFVKGRSSNLPEFNYNSQHVDISRYKHPHFIVLDDNFCRPSVNIRISIQCTSRETHLRGKFIKIKTNDAIDSYFASKHLLIQKNCNLEDFTIDSGSTPLTLRSNLELLKIAYFFSWHRNSLEIHDFHSQCESDETEMFKKRIIKNSIVYLIKNWYRFLYYKINGEINY